MILKKVYINFAIRLLLLTATIFLFTYAAFKPLEIYTLINLGVLIVIQILLLIRKFNLLNKELLTFFESVKSDETGLIFRRKTGSKVLDSVYSNFDDINKKINQIKEESVKSNQLFKNLVEHVNTGIILFDEHGDVEVINKVAKDFFLCGDIKNIHALDNKISNISKELIDLKPGSVKILKLISEGSFVALSFKTSDFKMDRKRKKLVSFQNIKEEIDQTETESWKKLIRILTHEIMNSTAPISSSIKVIVSLLKNEQTGRVKSLDELNEDNIKHTIRGLEIIEERSNSLSQFVNSYRELTKSKDLKLENFPIKDVFNSIEYLFNKEMMNMDIDFKVSVSSDNIIINADRKLIEQVLINLVKNSMESFSGTEKKQINLSSYTQGENIYVKVSDTGTGICTEDYDKIFIPFYSSKEGGSGIGLSLSKEIMQLHKGDIYFESEPGKGTVFYLKFQTF